MSLPFDVMFSPFEVYSVKEPAHRVAADLRARGVSHALFQLDETSAGRWEILPVDNDLFAALEQRQRTGTTVDRAIKDLLRKSRQRDFAKTLAVVEVEDLGDFMHSSPTFSTPALFRGVDGAVHGLKIAAGAAMPEQRVSVYPKLACSSGMEIAPEELVEFSVSIDVRPPGGVAAVSRPRFALRSRP